MEETHVPEVEYDVEWIAKLESLTHEQIMEAVASVGGHDFSYGARRSKDKLLEEASRLMGELRLALEAAVMEKERVGALIVSVMITA